MLSKNYFNDKTYVRWKTISQLDFLLKQARSHFIMRASFILFQLERRWVLVLTASHQHQTLHTIVFAAASTTNAKTIISSPIIRSWLSKTENTCESLFWFKIHVIGLLWSMTLKEGVTEDFFGLACYLWSFSWLDMKLLKIATSINKLSKKVLVWNITVNY